MSPETEAKLVAVLDAQTKVLARLEERLAVAVAPLDSERRLATLAEAMDLLGVKRARLFALVKDKKIVRVLVGRKARFDVESIERYLADQIAIESGAPRRGRPLGSKNKKSAVELEIEKMEKLKP